MSKKTLAVIALALATAIWGATNVVLKLTFTEIPPFTLAFARFVLASLLIVPLFFFDGTYQKIQRQDLPRFLWTAFLGVPLTIGFMFLGIARTSAIDASVISTIVPIVNMVFAWMILREKPLRQNITGMLIGFSGTLVVIGLPLLESGSASGGNIWGNLLVLIGSLAWVGYIISSKDLMDRYSPFTITAFSFLIGILAFAPLAFVEYLNYSEWVFSITMTGFFGLLFITIFSTLIAIFAWQWGLKYFPAEKAGVFIYLQPIVTVLVAVPLLGEKVTPPFLAGGALIALGLFLSTRAAPEKLRQHLKEHVGRRRDYQI